MKKLIFVIVCLVLIVTFGILEQNYVNNTLTELINKVTDISLLLENEKVSLAEKEILDTMQWWYLKRDFLEFMCPNNDLKDIAKELGELYGATKINAEDDPLIRCQVIIEMTKNSKDLLAFKWKNVF